MEACSGKHQTNMVVSSPASFVRSIVKVIFLVSFVSSGRCGSWTTENVIGEPVERGDNCAAYVNGKVYVIGGRAERWHWDGIKNQSIEVYDTLSRTWSNLGRMTFEVHHGACVVLNGKIWVVGSYYGDFPFEIVHEHIHVFDPSSGTWQEHPYLPNNPSRRRAAAAVAVYNGSIFISHGSKGGHGQGQILSYIDEYNPATGKWNPNGMRKDGPNPRGHTAGAVTEGKLCVVGGRDDSVPGFFNALVLATDCYDFAKKSWTVEPDIPQKRAGLGVTSSCDGRLFSVAGEGNFRAYQNTDVFTPSEGWKKGPNLAIPRHGVSLVRGSCDCGFMYISGGATKQGGRDFTTTTERYNPGPASFACGGTTSTSPTTRSPVITERTTSGIPSTVSPTQAVPTETETARSTTSTTMASPTTVSASTEAATTGTVGTAVPPTTASAATQASTTGTMGTTVSTAAMMLRVIDAGSQHSDSDTIVSGENSAKYVSWLASPILGAQGREEFRSHRYGRMGSSFEYIIPATALRYRLVLGFSEVWEPNCVAGGRVFSVSLNSVVVASDLDVFGIAGCRTAHTKGFDVSPDDNGNVRVSFQRVSGSGDPFVSLVELREIS